MEPGLASGPKDLTHANTPSEEASESEQDTPIVADRTETCVPNINDAKARRPVAGELQISASAIRGRMYRIMKPTLNGKFKVSQSILDDWAKPAGTKERLRLSQIFQMCGYCPDSWICMSIRMVFVEHSRLLSILQL